MVLSEETQAGLKGRGFARADMLVGAKMRLHGPVIRDDRFTVVQVADVDQIDKLLPRNQPAAPPKAAVRTKAGNPKLPPGPGAENEPVGPADQDGVAPRPKVDPNAAKGLVEVLDDFAKGGLFVPGQKKK